jgi:hypothetical protein
MSETRPVVVYAASGYTGRLVCESLTKLGVPFVAAGRSQARLEEVAREMRAKGGDCGARAVEHTPQGLRELLRGAKVVVNVSGPFSLLGRAVVDAALDEGVHYLDVTGEQDFMLDVRRDCGERFERARLLLSPSAAFLWGPGTLAAEQCLETYPGAESIEVVYAPPSLQTVASLQSMARVARRPGYAIAGGELRLLPTPTARQFDVPGLGARRALRLPAGESTFLLGHPGLRQCDTWFANNDLAHAGAVIGAWSRLSNVIPGETLDRWSDALIEKLKRDPPPEDPATARFVVTVTAQGPGRTVCAVVNGTAAYIVTGFLGAMAAQDLVAGKAERFGYRSLGQAFGVRHVITRLREVGTRITVDGVEPDRIAPAAPARRANEPQGVAHAAR